MYGLEMGSNPPGGTRTESPLLKLPDEILALILLHVAEANQGFLDMILRERNQEIQSVRAVMLTCKRLVPAATRALYFAPEFYKTSYSTTYEHRLMYKAWLFRKNLLDKPELAGMVRNLTHLPILVSELPPLTSIARTASAIARAVVQHEFQRQVLQLATAATSVGVLLTDPEEASKVGAILATRRLSHVRVAYIASMGAPVSAFAAFLESLRSGGESGAPDFSALRIELSFDEYRRDTCCIDGAQNLHYEVHDLEIGMEPVDIEQATFFLPSDVAKLEKLRYRLRFLFARESFEFAATTLEQRVEHNTITEFAIDCGKPLDEYQVYREHYSEPHQHDVGVILYPPTLFGLFPSLENLLLSHGVYMTIELLELLADTSPGLKVLNLPFTFWNVDAGDLVETKRGGLCLFETELLATLDRLEQLRRVDLGILPFSTNRPAKAFRAWAKGRGIKLTASWCMDRGDDDYIQRRSDDGSYFTDESTSESDDFNPDNYSSDGFDFGFGYGEARSSPPRGYAPSW